MTVITHREQKLMRQQSKLQIRVRNTIIGGPRLLICLPLVAEDLFELQKKAPELAGLHPDLIEWRFDGYQTTKGSGEWLVHLHLLRKILGDIPLLFTCRNSREGGLQPLSDDERLEFISKAILSGDIDLVDTELDNDKDFLSAILERTRASGIPLILSHHNFQETPGEKFIYEKILAAAAAGADIPKIAVMPKNYGDVLTLLSATNRVRNGAFDGPLITISMGEEGGITRLAGGLFGSDITFAMGIGASAPGQIPLAELRRAMDVLYR